MSMYYRPRLFAYLSAIVFVLNRFAHATDLALRAFVDLSFRALSTVDCRARLLLDRIGRMVGVVARNARAVFAFMRRALRHDRYSAGSFILNFGATA